MHLTELKYMFMCMCTHMHVCIERHYIYIYVSTHTSIDIVVFVANHGTSSRWAWQSQWKRSTAYVRAQDALCTGEMSISYAAGREDIGGCGGDQAVFTPATLRSLLTAGLDKRWTCWTGRCIYMSVWTSGRLSQLYLSLKVSPTHSSPLWLVQDTEVWEDRLMSAPSWTENRPTPPASGRS